MAGCLNENVPIYTTSFKEVSGESGSVTTEKPASWKKASLPTMLSQSELKDTYNSNELSLLYQAS